MNKAMNVADERHWAIGRDSGERNRQPLSANSRRRPAVVNPYRPAVMHGGGMRMELGCAKPSAMKPLDTPENRVRDAGRIAIKARHELLLPASVVALMDDRLA
jgi:hypothetical protein